MANVSILSRSASSVRRLRVSLTASFSRAGPFFDMDGGCLGSPSHQGAPTSVTTGHCAAADELSSLTLHRQGEPTRRLKLQDVRSAGLLSPPPAQHRSHQQPSSPSAL
ncbi:hypothetical protein SRHO_G00035830 [Serrasalmus rhombeus]